MKVIYINNLNEIFNKEELSLMLGNFDGFHLGHKELLKVLLKINTKKGLLTFCPHPSTIFNESKFYSLDTIEDKEDYLKDYIDYIIVLKTSKEILNSSKETFINFLIKNNVKSVVCGNDYTFGYKKEGNVKDLNVFDLHLVKDFKIENKRVSSTLIRECLKNGEIEAANKLLGRYYFIKGIVTKGAKIGRTIGFPTANIEDTEYLLPKKGVYFCYAYVDDQKYKAMVNIGINPTINLIDKVRLEAHILDFNKDIYDKEIKIEFIKKLRDEKKFKSKEELIETLIQNKQECEKLV